MLPNPRRDAFQSIFGAAGSRLSELSPERCRDVEMRQVRALRFAGPRPPMLRALIARMKEEEPSEAWRDRCYHNMRRVTRAMLDTDARPDDLRVALNAYLDGQVELASRWFTVDILLRPWGEH